MQNHIASHDEFAATYDAQVQHYSSYGHDILFGMCYEFVKAGDSLLDLGIGTGLSSMNFARLGLSVTGLDGSAEMLNECRKKGFDAELRHYDIRSVPLPFTDASFSHVICCGVLHFFGDLRPIFSEAFRLLKSGGIFALTIASLSETTSDTPLNFIETPSAWGIPVFKHSDNYLQTLSQSLGLDILKQQKVLVDSGEEHAADLLFKVYVMQKS